MAVSPLLEVERLAVRDRARVRLDGVSLTVDAGEIVAVIGPNGAGKTTLLEAIAGLVPSEGAVRARGRAVRSFADHAAAFAFLPDAARLPPEVTVRTLVDESSASSVARDAFAIDALLDRTAGTLSRGEAQRVALYLAVATKRPIVLLDEPFGAFDPLQLERILEGVRAVAADGHGVVASLHQLADAEKIAHRVLLLADGRVVAFDTPAALREATGERDATLERAFVTLLERRRHAP